MYSDWHPQDWILIVEAISSWDVHYGDDDPERARRARQLQAEIAAMHGFDDPVDFVWQADS